MSTRDAEDTGNTTLGKPFKGSYWLLAVALGLSFAVRMSAVDEGYFTANWVNVNNETRGISASWVYS